MLVFSICVYCCVLAIVHELIKMNDTIIRKTPFIMENVKRMQKMAAYLIIKKSCMDDKIRSSAIGQVSKHNNSLI